MSEAESIVVNCDSFNDGQSKRIVVENIINNTSSSSNLLDISTTAINNSVSNSNDCVTIADPSVKTALANDAQDLKSLPQLARAAKRSYPDDVTHFAPKKSKTSNMVSIKEEPVEFKFNPPDEEADFNNVNIEVCNSDFFDVFDKTIGCISNMYTKTNDDPLNYVECTICFKKIKESSMKQHFRTHAGLRPHPCDICGTRFTRKGDVYRHKRVVHGKVKPFICKKCEKTFPDRHLLIVHLKNHDKCIYYECGTCGYKFGKKEYYENHMRYIHPSADGSVPIFTKEEDIVDAQLKELEEEDDGVVAAGSSQQGNKTDQSDSVEEIASNDDEDMLDDVDENSSGGNCTDQSNGSCHDNKLEPEPPIPSVQLQTVSKINGKDEDLVNKILDAAVAQSSNTLEQLASKSQQKQKWLKSKDTANSLYKQKPMDLVIKTSVDGQLRRFIIQIQTVKDFELTSDVGMELIVSMVNQLCEGKGAVTGPIEVELHDPTKMLTAP